MGKLKQIGVVFVTCLIVLLSSQMAIAATYYIDYISGADSYNGTSTSTPWKRCPGMKGFAGSYSHSAGDVFVFKGGVTWPYTTLPLTISYSGTAGNIDTYMGGQLLGTPWGTGYPVFDGDLSLGANNSGIYSYGKSYLLIDGIKVIDVGDPSTHTGNAIILFTGSSIEVKNCWLQPEGLQAFAYDNGSGTQSKIYFHDNHISRAGRSVIYGDTGTVVDDVRIYNNEYEGPGNLELGAYHGDGFMMGNPATAECTSTATATVTNILFYNNKFYGDWSQGVTAQYYSNGCTDTTTIYNNVFAYDNTTCTDPSGKCFSPGLVVIYNKDKNIKIYNNTFSNDGVPGYGVGAGTGITINNTISPGNVDIKNNIFSRIGNVINYDTVATIAIDYNLYYSSGGETSRIIWNATSGSSWECATISACQSHGMEAHAPAMADPKFTTLPNGTPGHGVWSIQSSSPAIHKGVDLSALFTTDYLGYTRTGTWDIGAYEYMAEAIIGKIISGGIISGGIISGVIR